MNNPIDQCARQTALDVSRSFIVQAPAGSGKTQILIKRFLRLLTIVSVPEEIIAITFTRKAANEMLGRVVAALDYAQNKSLNIDADYNERELYQFAQQALLQDKNKDWQLLKNINRLRIQTIDSLSHSLVRQMPWSAGFGAAPASVADNVSELYELAAQRSILDALAHEKDQEQAEQLLLVLDNNFERLCGLLGSMLARRDQWLGLLQNKLSQSQTRDYLESAWQELIRQSLDNALESLPLSLQHDLLECARYSAANLTTANKDSPIRQLLDIEQLPTAKIDQLLLWQALADLLLTNNSRPALRKPGGVNVNLGFPPGGDKVNIHLKKQMMGLLSELQGSLFIEHLVLIKSLPQANFSESEWATLQALIQMLKNAAAQLLLVFQEQGVCDHVEMAARASMALVSEESPSDLSLRLDYKISHLLVDEFQDTSHSQVKLLEQLMQGWQHKDGRSLFLVGDPMQSIYRFREADVGIFLDIFAGDYPEIDVDPLSLQQNFRSTPALVDWINETFSGVFPKDNNPVSGAVSYAPSTAIQSQTLGNAVAVHETDEDNEAQQLTDLISTIRQQQQTQKIAILVRSRNHLSKIVSQLQYAQHAFGGVKIDRLSKRSCIQDLMALTKALLHPGDRLSWLACLRAPWCGLSLIDLTTLAKSAKDKTLWQIISEESIKLDDNAQSVLSRFHKAISPWVDLVGRAPLDYLLRQAWTDLGGPVSVSRTDASNANLYFEMLAQLQTAGQLADFRLLEHQVDNLWALPDKSGSALQLMTMHNAKGLEFDVVMLPGLFKAPRNDDPRLFLWQEYLSADAQFRLLVSPLKSDSQSSVRYNFVKSFADNAQDEEIKRLLYVACTRARLALHLFVSANPKKGSLQYLMPQYSLADSPQPSAKQTEPINDAMHTPIEYQRLPENYLAKPSMAIPLGLSSKHIQYQWVGVSSRHLGSLIHELLCELAQGRVSLGKLDLYKPQWRNRLLALGVEPEHINHQLKTIKQSLLNMSNDSKGQWILSNQHRECANEWELSYQGNGLVENIIIDRTFIDDKGVRWIIDYKTSIHQGSNLAEFLDNEVERYRSQLENYARILRLHETGSICLGLYFPLLCSWREWEYVD